MILGFLLTALYIPGIAGAATSPRWALLAVGLPIIMLLRGGVATERTNLPSNREGPRVESWELRPGPRFTLVHFWGCLYLTWVSLSLIWTPNRLDGLGELAKLLILAQAFVLGQRLVNLRSLLVGSAMGLCLSSILLLVQFGYPDIVLHTTTHSGLFINSGSLAEIAAPVLIGLVYERIPIRAPCYVQWFGGARLLTWLLTLVLLPCIILPASRGAWLALITAAIVHIWTKFKLSALALMALVAILLTYSFHLGFHVSSVVQRLGMWSDAIVGLNYLGHGLGSFWTDYAPLSNTLDIFEQRPEHLHNDWLEVLFELGPIGFIALAGCLAQATMGRVSAPTLTLAGIAAEALVGFPLHNPCTAFLAALCFGHLARDGADIRDLFHAGRVSLRAWHERLGKHTNIDWDAAQWCKAIPARSQVQDGISSSAR